MNVRDCMKVKVISIRDDQSIGEAAVLFRQWHIGTLPVIDPSGKLVGLVRLRKLLNLVMPDFVSLVDHFEFVHDFGALEMRQPDPDQLKMPVLEIMDEPIFVQAGSGLLRAAALLHHHDLKDLPVVNEDELLVGLVSHVDLGVALMNNWVLT